MSRRRSTWAPSRSERGDASPLTILLVVLSSIVLSILLAGLYVGLLYGAAS
jgi:hypothetical protein